MNNSLSIVKNSSGIPNGIRNRPAIVTGSRGQDGTYLRELLGYENTIGIINPNRESNQQPNFQEYSLDFSDRDMVFDVLESVHPKSIFHLAAKHGPSTRMTYSQDDISAMKRIHVESTRYMLEAIEKLGLDTHLVVAGSSRIFTPHKDLSEVNEKTDPNPSDFYGESKLEAWELVKEHRKEYGTRASFLILFNHESPKRPTGYFSQDAAKAVNAYLSKQTNVVNLRDADFMGDWCDARDVTRLMALVGNLVNGEDFVVASGNLRSVRSVIQSTLEVLGLREVPILSSSPSDFPEGRMFLKADNSKSIQWGLWHETIKIEQTIAGIVKSILSPLD